jgi:hypothetical protein
MNRSNKSVSINVFQYRGTTFIPKRIKPDINRESEAETCSQMKLSRQKEFEGNVVSLQNRFMILMSRYSTFISYNFWPFYIVKFWSIL